MTQKATDITVGRGLVELYNPEQYGATINAMHVGPNRDQSKELLEERASRAIEQGLRNAYDVWLQLGAGGTEATSPNQYGDVSLVADIQSEAAMLSAIQNFGAQCGSAVTVHSEEHGVVCVGAEAGEATAQPLLAVIDGLDGSSVYKKNREQGKYGTMFALFANDDPLYSQYLAAGILLHNERSILLASQGQPLKAINLETGEETYPQTASTAQLNPGDSTYVDKANVAVDDPLQNYYALNSAMAEALEARLGVATSRSGSTAATIGAVATGRAVLDLAATRKGNLEYATGYAILAAAGGVVADKFGTDLGTRRFLQFGQTEHEPIIVAANQTIASQVADALKAVVL